MGKGESKARTTDLDTRSSQPGAAQTSHQLRCCPQAPWKGRPRGYQCCLETGLTGQQTPSRTFILGRWDRRGLNKEVSGVGRPRQPSANNSGHGVGQCRGSPGRVPFCQVPQPSGPSRKGRLHLSLSHTGEGLCFSEEHLCF